MTRPPKEPPPLTRVEINAGGHQVVVEAAVPLDVAKRAALSLWKATDSPSVVRSGSAMGFTADMSDGLVPDALTLPNRLRPDEDGDRKST